MMISEKTYCEICHFKHYRADSCNAVSHDDEDDLKTKLSNAEEENKKLKFMIDNELDWNDLVCSLCNGDGLRIVRSGRVECQMCSGTGEITKEMAKENKG